MDESQRISDCRAQATVIDSQTTIPPLGENLQQRVKPHPVWISASELFIASAIWANAESYGLHTHTHTVVPYQGQTELFSGSELVGCGGSPH